jgi:GATA-binding protein
VSAGSYGWNTATIPQQNTSWPELPPPVDGNEEIDPALFETLAKLLEQSDENKEGGGGNQAEFDLMAALQHAMNDPANQGAAIASSAPVAPVPAPMPAQQNGPGMSQSLLTRRLQQQGPSQLVQNTYPSLNLNTNLAGPAVQPGSLPVNAVNVGYNGTTSPAQGLGSSFNNMRHSVGSQSSNWPVPERAMPWTDTPVSTPGGSELNSPILGGSNHSPYFSQLVANSSRSRPPVIPIRREAPQNPAPLQSPHGVSVGSTMSASSSRHPSVDLRAQPQSQSQYHQQPQMTSMGQAQFTEPGSLGDWAAQQASTPNIDMSNLPPLPPGFSMEQMGQMGAAGFEMAVRMGMSLALAAQQNGASANGHSTSTPQTHVSSGQGSTGASPADMMKAVQSPNLGSADAFGRSFPKSLATSPTMDMPSGASSFPVSRRPSQGDIASPLAELISPDDAAKKDPLATQVWKAYARAREALPNGHRMENLTWRMMHLTLKKQEELAAAAAAKEMQEKMAAQVSQAMMYSASAPQAGPSAQLQSANGSTSANAQSANDGEQRGRRKGKSRVVGFQNQKEESPAPE